MHCLLLYTYFWAFLHHSFIRLFNIFLFFYSFIFLGRVCVLRLEGASFEVGDAKPRLGGIPTDIKNNAILQVSNQYTVKKGVDVLPPSALTRIRTPCLLSPRRRRVWVVSIYVLDMPLCACIKCHPLESNTKPWMKRRGWTLKASFPSSLLPPLLFRTLHETARPRGAWAWACVQRLILTFTPSLFVFIALALMHALSWWQCHARGQVLYLCVRVLVLVLVFVVCSFFGVWKKG